MSTFRQITNVDQSCKRCSFSWSLQSIWKQSKQCL